ncbi:MAG: MerC domain-containing protein [Pseudomonadales bacterium]
MRLDMLGLALSGTCFVHCLLLPVAVLAAPTVSVWLGETERSVHWLLFAIALVVTGWALLTGLRRHGVAAVVFLGGAGLLIMMVGAAHLFGPSTEVLLTLTGAGVVATAHVLNLRFCERQPG